MSDSLFFEAVLFIGFLAVAVSIWAHLVLKDAERMEKRKTTEQGDGEPIQPTK